jgi:hypothetical protein
VAGYLELAQLGRRYEPEINVGGKYAARRPDSLCQPPGYAAAPGAYLPACPPFGDARADEVLDGRGIKVASNPEKRIPVSTVTALSKMYRFISALPLASGQPTR